MRLAVCWTCPHCTRNVSESNINKVLIHKYFGLCLLDGAGVAGGDWEASSKLSSSSNSARFMAKYSSSVSVLFLEDGRSRFLDLAVLGTVSESVCFTR
jgi:hypothetical protein